MARFETELLKSRAFEKAQKEIPDWNEYVRRVVVPVPGDLVNSQSLFNRQKKT